MEVNEIREDEERVAEDATPESNEEAVEQRTDDYEGLARRIDDVLARLDRLTEGIERMESAVGIFVESGATVQEGVDPISDAVIDDSGLDDIVDETLEEVVAIDDLDLL